jgi:RNA polymerase sigma-70 factor (ECF subfamily)
LFEAPVEEAGRLFPGVVGADAERALIDRAIAGSVEAFAALYDRYLVRVYRHVYYHLGNRSDAEDITQQVFLRAWQAMPRYRPTDVPLVGWLLTIAHNLVVSFYRRTRDERPLDLDPVAGADWSDPERELLRTYDRAAVRRAILRLKPDYQRVIVLRFVEGFGYDAIAAILGKTEGNVRMIQHRALAELRRQLTHEVKS